MKLSRKSAAFAFFVAGAALSVSHSAQPQSSSRLTSSPASSITVLHAARLFDVETGRIISPGEILIEGEFAFAKQVQKFPGPPGTTVIDLGDTTLLPGLIDAHVHLFLHPGAEDLQTVQESVPQRTIVARFAAREDLMAGFTAERDMGTEGAGSADTAVRNAIDKGLDTRPSAAHQRQCDRHCSAATRMQTISTPRSKYCPTPTTPIARMNW